MKIITFNTNTGVYNFELEALETDWHAHPAVEIVMSPGSSLQLEVENKVITDVGFAIIAANIRHKLKSLQPTSILMVEDFGSTLESFCRGSNIVLEQGVFIAQTLSGKAQWGDQFIDLHQEALNAKTLDPRVQQCLLYFKNKGILYPEMMQVLQARTHLSESRLSHLFKKEMGISLKKYLVWSRLQEAIQYVITDQISLYDAALRSGFYDQAHLSKAFKQMLGLSPSKVYNSRMLQE